MGRSRGAARSGGLTTGRELDRKSCNQETRGGCGKGLALALRYGMLYSENPLDGDACSGAEMLLLRGCLLASIWLAHGPTLPPRILEGGAGRCADFERRLGGHQTEQSTCTQYVCAPRIPYTRPTADPHAAGKRRRAS